MMVQLEIHKKWEREMCVNDDDDDMKKRCTNKHEKLEYTFEHKKFYV
jgi:hypothetical protein